MTDDCDFSGLAGEFAGREKLLSSLIFLCFNLQASEMLVFSKFASYTNI